MSAPGGGRGRGSLLQGGGYSQGVSTPKGDVCSQGGLLPGGSAPRGSAPRGVCSGGVSAPPVNRMTDRCKNITLATTSLRPVTSFLASYLGLV